MSRSPFVLLLTGLLSSPSSAVTIETIRLDAPAQVASAPGAASFTAPPAPSLASSVSPVAPAAAPIAVAARPAAAATAAVPAQDAPAPAPAAAEAGTAPLRADAHAPAAVAARVADTVRSWGAPIEDIFTNHDVLLVGENHGSLESVNTLAREMPRLAAAGVKVLGIEGLKRPHQAEVDAYVSRRTDVLPDDALLFSPSRRASFRALLTAARAQGVRVVALGVPLDQWAAMTAVVASNNTGRPIREFAARPEDQFDRAQKSYEPGYNEAVAEVYLTRRNKAMAGFLLDAMSAGGKAVVLIGQAHVEGLDMIPGKLLNVPGAWGTLASELSHLAVRAFSLTQTGGLFISADSAYFDKLSRPKSYKAAEKVSPAGAPTYQPLGPDQGLWHAGARSGGVYPH